MLWQYDLQKAYILDAIWEESQFQLIGDLGPQELKL